MFNKLETLPQPFSPLKWDKTCPETVRFADHHEPSFFPAFPLSNIFGSHFVHGPGKSFPSSKQAPPSPQDPMLGALRSKWSYLGDYPWVPFALWWPHLRLFLSLTSSLRPTKCTVTWFKQISFDLVLLSRQARHSYLDGFPIQPWKSSILMKHFNRCQLYRLGRSVPINLSRFGKPGPQNPWTRSNKISSTLLVPPSSGMPYLERTCTV